VGPLPGTLPSCMRSCTPRRLMVRDLAGHPLISAHPYARYNATRLAAAAPPAWLCLLRLIEVAPHLATSVLRRK